MPLSTDRCRFFSCCKPHFAPPARTSCLTHDRAAARGCFLGERHVPEQIRPSPVCWPQNPLYFTGTKCHGCSHTTKECRARSSVIVFSSVSNGRGRAWPKSSPLAGQKSVPWVYVAHSYLILCIQREEILECLATPSIVPESLNHLPAGRSSKLRKDLQ